VHVGEDEGAIDEDGMPLPGRPPAAMNGVAATMAGLSIGRQARPAAPAPQPIGVTCTFPYLQKKFIYDNEEYLIIELLVPGRPSQAFRPHVSDNGEELLLPVELPGWFFDTNRLTTELEGRGENETFTQAHSEVVQVARQMFGATTPMSPPQKVLLLSKCRKDFIEVMRLDYDGREIVDRGGNGVRTFEHILRVTLKTTREMLKKAPTPTTYGMGDPDATWVHVRPVPGGGAGAGA